MKDRLRWLICISIFSIVLTGCAPSVVLVDRSNSLVMPDHIARKILARHFGDEWTQRPYLIPITSPFLFCKKEQVPIRFSDVKVIWYAVLGKQIIIDDNLNVIDGVGGIHHTDCGYYFKRITISVANESDAEQITEALIALGVPVKGYIRLY